GRILRARPAEQSWRGTVEGTEAAPADVRDGHHRAVSAARELGRGGADRDVSSRGVGASGRGHHRGIVGHASVAFDGVGPKQEDLRDDRGLAQSSDRGRAPLCLSRRHRAQAQLGRRGAQRLAAGCDRRERERLSGDSRHLRGAKEDKTGWSAFLKHLKEGVRLITSDACIWLTESAAEFFAGGAWQGCIVHGSRNIFSHVPSTKVGEIAAMLKAIHAGEDIAAAREKAIRVIEKLRGLRLSRAAELVEMAVEESTVCGLAWKRYSRQTRLRDVAPALNGQASLARVRPCRTGAASFMLARQRGRARQRAWSAGGRQIGNTGPFRGKPRRNGYACGRQSAYPQHLEKFANAAVKDVFVHDRLLC